MPDSVTMTAPQAVTLAASTRPASFDAESYELDVVWYTGATVPRYDMWTGDSFDLVLDLGAVDLGRLNAGAPVLDSHDGSALRNVVGKVVEGSARVEGGVGVATLRLSRRPEVAGFVQDVRDGIVSKLSVGASLGATKREKRKDQRDLVTATAWEPMEVSFVAVPADAATTTLAAQPAPPQESVMTEQTKPAEVVDLAAERAAAQTAERARVSAILADAKRIGLGADDAKVRSMIDAGVELAEARGKLLELAAARDEQTAPRSAGVRVGRESVDFAREGMIAALDARMGHSEVPEQGRKYANASLSAMCLEIAQLNHLGVSHLDSKERVVKLAMTTSDLDGIFRNALGKQLQRGYTLEEALHDQIPAMRRDPSDFRTQYRTQLGTLTALAEIPQGGDAQVGLLQDQEENYTPVKAGRQLIITEEMIINDDLGAMADLALRFGGAVRAYENSVFAGLFNSPPTMSDGEAWFSASHASGSNLGSAATMSPTTLNELIKLLRSQTAPGNGTEYVARIPGVLLVPEALRGLALQYLDVGYRPTSASVAINADIRGLRLASTPRLTSATAHYVIADGMASGIEYGWVAGKAGAQIESETKIASGNICYVVKSYYNAALNDWRGAAKNAGA